MKKSSPLPTSNRVSPSAAWLDDLIVKIMRDERYYMDSSFFSRTGYADGFMRTVPSNRTYYMSPAALGKIDNFTLAKTAHEDWENLKKDIETLPANMRKQLKPSNMYEDPQKLYANYLRSIFSRYMLNNMSRDVCRGTYDILVDFLQNQRGPVFFSQFLNSNLCPRTCSGFVIEMHNAPKDNLYDWYGIAQDWDATNTSKYFKMCKQNNFSLERESLLVLMHNSCPSYWGNTRGSGRDYENIMKATEVELEMFKMHFAEFYMEYAKYQNLPQQNAFEIISSIPDKYWMFEWLSYSVPLMTEESIKKIIKSPITAAFKADHSIPE